jgi:hypothetical protein
MMMALSPAGMDEDRGNILGAEMILGLVARING